MLTSCMCVHTGSFTDDQGPTNHEVHAKMHATSFLPRGTPRLSYDLYLLAPGL